MTCGLSLVVVTKINDGVSGLLGFLGKVLENDLFKVCTNWRWLGTTDLLPYYLKVIGGKVRVVGPE